MRTFKSVSPLAWLPIVMIVVGALYRAPDREAWFEKSFVTSAWSVSLCSLWPTLLTTAHGVASVPKEYVNVAQAFDLSWAARLRKIVIPSSLPLVVGGLRVSLCVGWMVLLASAMLARNPGLGTFVRDMFLQPRAARSPAQSIVAVFTVGGTAVLLDRLMVELQRRVRYDAA